MIIKHYVLAVSIVLFSICFYINSVGAEKESNRFEWATASPESQGLSSEKLEEISLLLQKRRTDALLVIRNDHIVLEWYAKGWDRTKQHYTASLAKVLAGSMSLLVALDDGLIKIDDPACRYISQWQHDPLKSKITIRHLATHSSGIASGIPVKGWAEKFWKRDPNPFPIARDYAPVMFEPGTSYEYSGPGYALLGYAITASLKGSSQTDIYTLLKERIMDPIGVPMREWSFSYGNNSYNTDGMKLYAIWGGGGYSIDAVSRIGRLMLQKGNWESKQLVDPTLVEEMVSYAGTPLPDRTKSNPEPALGLCWFTNFDGIWSSVPKDAFVGAGAGQQVLLVVPSLDLIIVRFGHSLDREWGLWGLMGKYIFNPGSREKYSYWRDAEKYIFNPIMKAIEK